ncbi:APG5-domain-containing protein [Meredithblackwellia eburnea MCA 4105]
MTSSPSPSTLSGTSSSSPLAIRSLVFSGSIPLSIAIAPEDLPPTADLSIDAYHVQAQRIGYLPLLIQDVRKYLVELVLDESSAAVVADDDVWFEFDGVPLKWHWPIGLLYDFHTSRATSSSSSRFVSPNASPSLGFAGGPAAPPTSLPWKLTLHLKNPPLESLLLNGGVDVCRTGFMNMIKEADYVRWGNTKRVTNLRKEQQDALWEGVVKNDFEKYWTVASKLVPSPSPLSSNPTPSASPLPGATPPSTTTLSPTLSTGLDGKPPEANAMRSVPMRIYLPDGAPVVQGVVVPLVNGIPTTLQTALSTLLPLLFPPNSQQALAQPIIHGIRIPLDTQVGWMGACLAGADGWVGLVLVLV